MCCLLHIILFFLTLQNIVDSEKLQIVPLRKNVKVNGLSPKQFYQYNVGHIIYNYYSNRKNETAHLKNFHNLGYVGRVHMGSPPEQPLDVIFDVGVADVMVLAKDHCHFPINILSSVCRNRRKFDETISFKTKETTYLWDQARYPAYDLTNGASELQGFLIYDKIKIADYINDKSLIGLIENYDGSFSYTVADGVVGLGRRKESNFVTTECVSGITDLDRKNLQQHKIFTEKLTQLGVSQVGFYLYKDKKQNEVGELVLGKTDSDDDSERYRGSIKWYSGTNSQIFWRLRLTRLQFVQMSDGQVSTLDVSSTATLVDPGTSAIAGPPGIINKIHEYIFKELKLPNQVKKYGTVEFNCKYKDQLPIISFVISSDSYILTPKDYIRQLGSSCTTGFLAVEKLTAIILGDPFFRRYYIKFNYSSNQVGLAELFPPHQKTTKKSN